MIAVSGTECKLEAGCFQGADWVIILGYYNILFAKLGEYSGE